MKLVIKYLSELITEERYDVLKKASNNRTRHLTVVLEDIFQPQNASAVLRTCDCFGVQDVHIIENTNEYNINPDVVMGASNWLSIHKYNQEKNNSSIALRKLKRQGYRVIATSPHADEYSLDGFDVTAQKTALVFGTELTGISDEVKNEADGFLKIPMYGFTESFNISVSAALILQKLMDQLRNSEIQWQLNEIDREKLLISWLLKTVKNSDMVMRRFYAENKEITYQDL